MRFSKSLKPPALSNYLLVDKNHNLHLAIPLIGGAYIGTDNTCQTAKALKQFFGADPTHTNTATHQLNEYKKQLELQLFFYQLDPATLDENKRSIIQKQLKQIGLLLTGIENIKQKPDFQNVISGHFPTLGNLTQDFLKKTNLCSISLRPFALDTQGTPKYPLFSTNREQPSPYFGLSVADIPAVIRNFQTESLAKSLAIKVKDFEYINEANFITQANRSDLFKQYFEAKSSIKYDNEISTITGNSSTDYLNQILPPNNSTLTPEIKTFLTTNRAKINFALDQIFTTLQQVLIEKRTISDQRAQEIINGLKTKESLENIIKKTYDLLEVFSDQTQIEDFVSTILNEASNSIGTISSTPFYTDNISLTHTTEEDAKSKMMLSIKLQFFLAQINIFLHDNQLLKTEGGAIPDFGKILDENQDLRNKFIAIISEENFRAQTVEEEIFKFIQKYFGQFKINSNGTLGLLGGLLSSSTFKFSDPQKDKIKELFTRNFGLIKESPHYDNFWILSEKKDGKVFSKGGNICVDFQNLASHFSIQSCLIDPSNLDDYRPLTCQDNNIEPANILDDSADEFVEIADDVLWRKITEKLTELKRDSIQDALRFLKIKHEDKYFFEDKATELKTFLEDNPAIKKALLLLANQEFKEDKVLLDKFLETINPEQKQIILTKDELRALYTTFASDGFPTIYSTGKYKDTPEESYLDDNPINGFEAPDDIKKILNKLFDTEYFGKHKTKNHDHYSTPLALIRMARIIEGFVIPQAPQNPPELDIDQLEITTSSFSAYISVGKAHHAQLDKFLKHIIKLNKNKLYIPSKITINGEEKNDSRKIYEEANKLNPGWDTGLSEQQLKLQRALHVCGIDLPLDNIQFSGNNGYTIKFTSDNEARRIEEIIYPPAVLSKSSCALIYQLVNHLCSREISNQLNDLVNGDDFKKIKFALKALGINHFGNFNYNNLDGYLIRVDPKIEKFFGQLSNIAFNCEPNADYRTYQQEAIEKFTSNQDPIKKGFEELTSLLIGFEEKCLFGEFDRAKFSATLITSQPLMPAEKKQEVIKICRLHSCKYQDALPQPSNEKNIRIYCPTRILSSFQELLRDKKEILGSKIKNPYDSTEIEIPQDSRDLTAYHLHILARNEKFNATGVMEVELYKGLLDPNEIAQLRCLVKATNLVSVAAAKSYGGYKNGRDESTLVSLTTTQKVIIIDQSGLQWQGDHRNTGGLFFYPTNKNDPNLSGGNDGTKFSEWQESMYEAMYQRKRPQNSGTKFMGVCWNNVEGKIDLDQLAFGIKEEFLQAFASAVNSSDLIDDDGKIYFKFLKAGMGFFAEGIGARFETSEESKKIREARLEGIIMALEELKARIPKGEKTQDAEEITKKIFKKVEVIEFPFSADDGDQNLRNKIEKLVKSLGLKYENPTNNDALQRHDIYQNYIIATTNTGDPHALAGNEGDYGSVDAAISCNLENPNCLNPLINQNFKTQEAIKSSQEVDIKEFKEEEIVMTDNIKLKKFTPTLNFQGIKYQDDRFSFASSVTTKDAGSISSEITAGLISAKDSLADNENIPAEFFLAVMQISSYNQGIGSMDHDKLEEQLSRLLGNKFQDNYPDLAKQFSAEFQKKMVESNILTGRQQSNTEINSTGMRLFRASNDQNIKNFFENIAPEKKENFSELLQKNYQRLSEFEPSKTRFAHRSASRLSERARART